MEFLNVQINGKGKILLQVSGFKEEDFDSRWGFFLTDGESAWDGGFGIADNQEIVATKRSSKTIEWAKEVLLSGQASVNLRRYSFDDY